MRLFLNLFLKTLEAKVGTVKGKNNIKVKVFGSFIQN